MKIHKKTHRDLIQSQSGYKYNIDSMLLARFAQFKENEKVCDLGTGVGLIAILSILKGNVSKAWGIEVQPELAEFAKRNIEELNLSDKMELIICNWKDAKKHLSVGSIDLVISNPPYRKLMTGKVPQESVNAIARHEIKGTMQDLISSARALMKPKGRLVLMYPVLRLEEFITELSKQKLKVQRLCFVHPYSDRSATHFMVEVVRSVAGEIIIEKPLIIYKDPDHYQKEIEEWVDGKKLNSVE